MESVLLASIVEGSDDAIVSKDLKGTILSWNKAAEKIFGYSATEAVGRPISIIIPPERASEEIEILRRISRGEPIEHFETIRIRKDGSPVEVSLTISPLVQDGQVIGAAKIARDISEQKRLLREAEQERARLQVTLASIGDGVIVTDLNANITFINPTAEALTGWKSSDAAGKPLEAVFQILNETTRRRVENPVVRALRDGICVGLANHTILISKDGSEYAIDDSAAPIRNSSNEVMGVVLVFRDVSAARASEEFRGRLAAIVQSSDDAIIGKDLNGRITSWNAGATRLYGYTAEEAIGQPIAMLIPPERLAEEAGILDRLRHGQRVEHFETVRVTKERKRVEVSLTISPVCDAEGHVVGASKIARDITQRKQTERELIEAREKLKHHAEELERTVAERTAELRAANRELEAFAYSVAHDLRAPLRSILGFLEVLRNEHKPPFTPEQSDLLNRIENSADRMSSLVDDLLKLSRIRKEELELKPTPFGTLVQEAVAEFKTDPSKVKWQIASFARCPM